MIIDGQNIDELPQAFSYNEDGTLAYVEVTTPTISGSYAGGTYRRSFTYTSGQVTAISAWTKQP